MEIVAKWFFEYDTNPSAALEQSHLMQFLHRDRHDVRWQCQVEYPVLRHVVFALQPSDILGQQPIVLRSSFLQGLVVKTLLAPGTQLCFLTAASLLQTFDSPETEFLLTQLRHGGADDQRVASVQDSLISQFIECG